MGFQALQQAVWMTCLDGSFELHHKLRLRVWLLQYSPSLPRQWCKGDRTASCLLAARIQAALQGSRGRKPCACWTATHLCVGYQIAAAARSSGRGRCQCLGQPGYRALGDFGAGGSWALWTRKGESGGWLSSNLIKNSSWSYLSSATALWNNYPPIKKLKRK